MDNVLSLMVATSYMLLDSSEALVEAIPLTENVKRNLSAAEAHEYLN